ncbi:hypothetical protein EN942_36025, partial [Mesorhizobium sp. M7A.F.Ca.CA.001.14.1.1]|uniref:IclR family transcriptional regulator domain-containing protein n=1 Tax=Mesorhizobium sp. M7A.F.Ca.CA.001.14.1.1 TaxID=2496706 RepID=UPI000FD48311
FRSTAALCRWSSRASNTESVQTIDDLIAEMRDIRTNGFNCDDQQVADGIICFGAPVLNSLDRPIAAMAGAIV